MQVYCVVLLIVALLAAVKVVDFVVDVIRRQHSAVRKEDWLVSVFEVLSERRGPAR